MKQCAPNMHHEESKNDEAQADHNDDKKSSDEKHSEHKTLIQRRNCHANAHRHDQGSANYGCHRVSRRRAISLFGHLPYGGPMCHHNRLTYWLLETLRERSVARAASDIDVPHDLNASERLLAGGADYNDMCAGCHLKPGKTESDFTLGLYPRTT